MISPVVSLWRMQVIVNWVSTGLSSDMSNAGISVMASLLDSKTCSLLEILHHPNNMISYP